MWQWIGVERRPRAGGQANLDRAKAAPTAPSSASAAAAAPGECPPAQETNPSGDIPDNQAYVGVRTAPRSYSIKGGPEGWSRHHGGAAR